VGRIELPPLAWRASALSQLSYTHESAGRRIRTFRMQCLRLPRLPIAPYLLVASMRTRGFEPPTTAFSGLRVCRLRHVRKSIGRDSNSRPRASETRALWFQLSYRCVKDQCRRQDSNLHPPSSELGASAKLRHAGTPIPGRGPGTRTPKGLLPGSFQDYCLAN
jgi:hypothetical protein